MNKALIAIDRSKSFRVYLPISTDLVQEAAKIHDTTPLASAGLGRVLTAAGLMGIMLKDDDNKLTLHFKGDGPARQILATAYGDGRVKGYISNPYVNLPLNDQGKLDVGGSLGVGDQGSGAERTVHRDYRAGGRRDRRRSDRVFLYFGTAEFLRCAGREGGT